MNDDYEVLKVYSEKQRFMISDLLSKVLMLETKLELLQKKTINNTKEEAQESEKPRARNSQFVKK